MLNALEQCSDKALTLHYHVLDTYLCLAYTLHNVLENMHTELLTVMTVLFGHEYRNDSINGMYEYLYNRKVGDDCGWLDGVYGTFVKTVWDV